MRQHVSSKWNGDRSRLGWWAFIVVLAVVAAYITYSFLDIIVLGVFGYYATRPIYRRLNGVSDHDGIVAGATLILVTGPILLLSLYAGFQLFQQIQHLVATNSLGSVDAVRNSFGFEWLTGARWRTVSSALQNPRDLVSQPRRAVRTVLGVGFNAASVLVGALVTVGLALTLSYALLERDDGISRGLVELFGGRDTTAYTYASLVDEDLESVFFGNLVFVLAMSVIAAVAYTATNYVTPPSMHIPMVFTLAFLTGVASLIPLVVGKIVYLPVVVYLAVRAIGAGGNHLVLVGGVLVAYFLVLDILPQTFVQPYITGRQLDVVLLMFGYILGPILFGWYGFFLLPIVFIAMLEAIRVVLPELVHGEPLTPDISLGEGVGTAPGSAMERRSPVDGEESETD